MFCSGKERTVLAVSIAFASRYPSTPNVSVYAALLHGARRSWKG